MTDVEKRDVSVPAPAGWDYAPAPEARDIVSLQERYGLFVGGQWLEYYGAYDDEYAFTDGRWKFARRDFRVQATRFGT